MGGNVVRRLQATKVVSAVPWRSRQCRALNWRTRTLSAKLQMSAKSISRPRRVSSISQHRCGNNGVKIQEFQCVPTLGLLRIVDALEMEASCLLILDIRVV